MTWTPDHLAPPTLGGHLYGELNYLEEKRRFRITGDASMMQVARRMFPGANVHKDHLSFVHTRRVAEDLNWFLLRFPLRVLCPEKLEEARQQAIEHVRRRTTNDDLTPCDPPASFLGNLFTYQSEGVTFLNANERCVLADGMGLGKTWTALGAVAARGEYPVLIVVQPQVQRQWQRQVGRLFDLPCIFQTRWDDTDWTRAERRGAALAPILRGNTPYQIPDTPFTIIHYGLLRSWHETLLQRKYRVIIWDEIQELRHTGTAKYSAASLLSSEVGCSWGLSGTPVYGYGSEIWSVMNIIDFQCLGSSESFSREWCTGYGERIVADPDALGDFLRREGLLLRRRWQEVRPQLPRVIRRVQDVEHDEGMHAQLMQRAVVQAQGYGACHWRDRGRVARDIDRQSRHAAGVSKAHAVAHFVRTLIAAGERPLVFAWHHDVHDILIEALAEFQVSVLTGRETEQAKDEALRRFSDGRSPVALLSLRTAAGVDGLQERATCAVMAELDWAPAVMGQCLDEETEILTQRGFVRHNQLLQTDLSVAFDMKTEKIYQRPIIGRVTRGLRDGEKMFSISSRSVDIRVTGGHRMIYRTGRSGDWKIETAERLACHSQNYHIPVSGFQTFSGVGLTDDELRFLGWFLTDGEIDNAKRQVKISQSVESDFNDAIRSMLLGCGFQFGVHVRRKPTNYGVTPRYVYSISRTGPKVQNGRRGFYELIPYLEKSMNHLYDNLDARQFGVFLESFHQGDGAKRVKQVGYDIGTGRREVADLIQSLCVRRGWRANLSTRKTPLGNPYYEIRTKQSTVRSIGGTSCKDREILSRCSSEIGELVWCVENDLGTIIIRRNGKTAIVGNCETRVARVGAPKDLVEVPSYYCISETGYDQVMLDVLGLKTEQFCGIMGDAPESAEERRAQDEAVARRIVTLIQRLGGSTDGVDAVRAIAEDLGTLPAMGGDEV